MGSKVQFAANFAHFPSDVPCYVIAPNQLFMSYDSILSIYAFSKNEHLKLNSAKSWPYDNTTRGSVTLKVEEPHVFWEAIFLGRYFYKLNACM